MIATQRMERVDLTPDLLAFAEYAAQERRRNNERTGLASEYRNHFNTGSEPFHVGVVGEIAAAKWLGLEPREHVRTDRPDDGADLTVNGRRLSVKTTNLPNKALRIPRGQYPLAVHRVDAALLLWPITAGVCDAMWIVGWATQAELAAHAIYSGSLKSPGYELQCNHLRHAATLREWLA